jgi:CRISPR/Cas system CSM-associated protein Csm5 (group 7 of RAMP superfamily)
MNTTNPKEDMFADFFQVGGYNNFAGATANIMKSKSKSSNQLPSSFVGAKEKELSQKLALSKIFGGNHNKFGGRITPIYNMIKNKFNYSDEKIEQLWADFKLEGNTDVSTFYRFVERLAEKVDESRESIVKDSIEEYKEELDNDKNSKPIPYLYIGLGAVVLVGVTILIVKR